MKGYKVILTQTEAEALTYAIGSVDNKHTILTCDIFHNLIDMIFNDGVRCYDRDVKHPSTLGLYYGGNNEKTK
jgi:hypothetical protein